ncbi:hypothetical protein BZA70DRAFT_272552 [Myxozyma melibiosi]|uniref:Pre-mRNA-splicing factor n=1 Tax=Myxozyma melibiosi TaxID=54550 RepID=A0ABR1FFJ9_9ASCO
MSGFKAPARKLTKPAATPIAASGFKAAGSNTAGATSQQSSGDASKPAFSFSLGGNAANDAKGKLKPGKFSVKLGSGLKGKGTTLQGRGQKRARSPSPTELIVGFDTESGNAITVNKEEESKPLVIVPPKNKNWIEEAKKKRALYMPVGSVIDAERDRQADEQEKQRQRKANYGLTFREKGQGKEAPIETSQKTPEVTEQQESESENQTDGIKTSVKQKQETKEEREIRKLAAEFIEEEKAVSDIVIKMASTSTTLSAEQMRQQALSEEEAYKLDIESRPDAPDMDAYESVPVEDFGYALLRGMGWKGDTKK